MIVANVLIFVVVLGIGWGNKVHKDNKEKQQKKMEKHVKKDEFKPKKSIVKK